MGVRHGTIWNGVQTGYIHTFSGRITFGRTGEQTGLRENNKKQNPEHQEMQKNKLYIKIQFAQIVSTHESAVICNFIIKPQSMLVVL